jgi:hypothetical protein
VDRPDTFTHTESHLLEHKKSHGRSSNHGSNSESTAQTFICVNELGRFRLQLGCPVGA